MAIRYFSINQPTPQNFDVTKHILNVDAAMGTLFEEVGDKGFYIYEGQDLPNKNAILHTIINYLLGSGKTTIPSKYLSEDGAALPIERGRSSYSINIDKRGRARHNYLITFKMPDDTINVLLFDIHYC